MQVASYCSQMSSYLLNCTPFVFSESGSNLKLRPTNQFHYLAVKYLPQLRNRHIQQVCQVFQAYFTSLVATPQVATVKKEIQAARLFYKSLPRHVKRQAAVIMFERQLLATRLGIPLACLNEEINPGFERFCRYNHLYNFLKAYKHELRWNDDYSIIILYQNHWTAWKDIPQEIKEEVKRDFTSEPWKYGQNGLQNKNLCYGELEPFKLENPKKWDEQYLYEIRTSCVNDPRTRGDHTWNVLRDNQGNVYSRGVMGKIAGYNADPLQRKEGAAQFPDVSEFCGFEEDDFNLTKEHEPWVETIQSIYWRITREKFLAVKESMSARACTFQLFDNNCSQDAMSFPRRFFGFEIPCKVHIAYLFCPKPLKRFIDGPYSRLPSFIKKVIEIVFLPFSLIGNFFLNLVQFALGSGKVHSNLKKQGGIIPHMQGIKDLFNFQKLYLYPPYILSRLALRLKKWRKEQLEQLIEQKDRYSEDEFNQRRLQILYDLPNWMVIPTPEKLEDVSYLSSESICEI